MPFTGSKKYCDLCKKNIIENKFARHTRTQLHKNNMRWMVEEWGLDVVPITGWPESLLKIYNVLSIMKQCNRENKWKEFIHPHLNEYRLSENLCAGLKYIFNIKQNILSNDEYVDKEILDVAINIMLIKHIGNINIGVSLN